MKTSVLVPTRARKKLFARLIKSIGDTARGEVEILVGADDDDPTDYEYPCVRYTGLGSSQKVYELAKLATGDMILMGATDEVFRTPGWDTKLWDRLSKFPDGLGVLFTQDGDTHRGSRRPVITRRWYEVAGFYPRHFWHFYADTWVVTIAEAVGRVFFVPEVIIDHLHPKSGRGEQDEIYNRRGNAETDKWKATEPERNQIIEKLKAEIERYRSGVREVAGD